MTRVNFHFLNNLLVHCRIFITFFVLFNTLIIDNKYLFLLVCDFDECMSNVHGRMILQHTKISEHYSFKYITMVYVLFYLVVVFMMLFLHHNCIIYKTAINTVDNLCKFNCIVCKNSEIIKIKFQRLIIVVFPGS